MASHMVIKYPTRCSLRQEGFMMVHSLRENSPSRRGRHDHEIVSCPWQWKKETIAHIMMNQGKRDLDQTWAWATCNPQGFLSNLLPLARIYIVDISKQPKIVLTMGTKCPKTQACGDIYTQTITQRTCSQTWSKLLLGLLSCTSALCSLTRPPEA